MVRLEYNQWVKSYLPQSLHLLAIKTLQLATPHQKPKQKAFR